VIDHLRKSPAFGQAVLHLACVMRLWACHIGRHFRDNFGRNGWAVFCDLLAGSKE
jgi:hypothetical protein